MKVLNLIFESLIGEEVLSKRFDPITHHNASPGKPRQILLKQSNSTLSVLNKRLITRLSLGDLINSTITRGRKNGL